MNGEGKNGIHGFQEVRKARLVFGILKSKEFEYVMKLYFLDISFLGHKFL